MVCHYSALRAGREDAAASIRAISIANGRWYSEVSRLLLPLAAEGEGSRVAFIMGADYARSIY